MATIIPSARVVQLEVGPTSGAIWRYADDGSDYSREFVNPETARDWMFTPLIIEPPKAAEPK